MIIKAGEGGHGDDPNAPASRQAVWNLGKAAAEDLMIQHHHSYGIICAPCLHS